MKTLLYPWVIMVGFSFLFSSSCQDKQTREELLKYQQKEDREASNIAIIKQFFKLYDEQKMEECSNLVATNDKWFTNSMPWTFKDAIPQAPALYSAFPDWKHNIEDIFAADDYVVAQIHYTGTHVKEFMGIDSTGNKIDYKGIFIFTMADGKIQEGQIVEDWLTCYNQLGLELK